jgi:hypothetical protein
MSEIMKRLRSRTRKLLGIGKRPKAHRDLKARFTYVYRGKTWKSSESASGPGSTLESGSVRQSLTALSQVVRDHAVQSIADLPCGDFNWMPLFLEQHPELTYKGYDIVDALVVRNRRAHPDRVFHVLDITTETPDRADLLFSKDLVNHLLERDVWSAVANMVRSGTTYLMITSNSDPVPNEELPENVGGASRPLNLQIAPYDFPPPIYDDGYLVMWRTTDLAFVLDRAATS